MNPRTVDVLRGMREVSVNLTAHFAGGDPYRSAAHQQEVDAIDAVMELIEADQHYDDCQLALARARYNGAPLHELTLECGRADVRRAAALARAQDGAA
jgi:hypothetical protein